METSSNPQTNPLHNVLNKYAVPDPAIVGKLPKGGTQLDFVGHADITRILIEIDPTWRLVPIAWENGRPACNIVNDMATMWFEMTLLGVSRLAIGSAKSNAPDLDKVLYGDALRNGAMRFGISLQLWSRQEWTDLDHNPAPKAAPTRTTGSIATSGTTPQPTPDDENSPLTEDQIAAFNTACMNADLNPMGIYKAASVKFGFAKQKDLGALRKAFSAAKTAKAEGGEA